MRRIYFILAIEILRIYKGGEKMIEYLPSIALFGTIAIVIILGVVTIGYLNKQR